MAINRQHIIQRLYAFFTNRIVSHSIIWSLVLFFSLFIGTHSNNFAEAFAIQCVSLTFIAAIVYFNLYYLIPTYLSKNQFLTYSALFVVACVIITPLRALALYLLFNILDIPIPQMLLLSFISIFLIASVSTVVKIINDWLRHTRERQELQRQTLQSELRFLKSQVNPHFLFNTLNNLYALTLKKDDRAPEIVIKLSEMMRYMLYECNEKRVPLRKEVSYIQNYLDLERLRQGKKVDINFEVNGRISEQLVSPLMFTPFLENSFKHGLNHHISQGFVNIQLNVDEQTVHFFIENSKAPALPKDPNRRSGGIGLVNVRRRLDLLYPEHYSLEIDNNPNTYAVDLMLDLE